MPITPSTRQELVNAWKISYQTSRTTAGALRNNAHRLLLFYAIECGLKAILLKNKGYDILDDKTPKEIKGHDLNKLLKELGTPGNYYLTSTITLPAIHTTNLATPVIVRLVGSDRLNEAWRYGSTLVTPTDSDMEQKLEKIQQWIAKEIR